MDSKNTQAARCGSTSSSESLRLRVKEAGGSDGKIYNEVNALGLTTRNASTKSHIDELNGARKEKKPTPIRHKRRLNTSRKKSSTTSNFPEPNIVLDRDYPTGLKDLELLTNLKNRNSSIDLSQYLIEDAKQNDTITSYDKKMKEEDSNMVENILAELINNMTISSETPDIGEFDFSERIGTLRPKKAKKPSKMHRIRATLRRVGSSIIRPFTGCFNS